MSYYIDHIILCDELTYGRMIEYWKQRNWVDLCEVRRPEHIWISTADADEFVKTGTYLLYLSVNHRPDYWELFEWLSDELGVDPMHFSTWSRGECDKKWIQEGTYVPEDTFPSFTVTAEYDENCINRRKAPEGYRTYEYCKIAVDPRIWDDVTVDYTRKEGIRVSSPEEELLREINDQLQLMEGLLECLLERVERQLPDGPAVD